jgi:thiamine-monophosphate kinase
MDTTNSSGLTPLTEVGEFGLINQIKKNTPPGGHHTLLGIGDDAAVLDSKGLTTVISTDCLVEGTHFDLAYVPLKHLGYKAVVVNLSDIFAMNARPAQILVSLSISSKYSLEAVDEIYAGIFAACEAYGVDLVGGDTSSSPAGMMISITAIGYGEKDRLTFRSGARTNDIICVTGDLGSAYAGLQLLTREKQIFQENPGVQPDLSGFEYILQRQLRPEARKELIDMLRDRGVKPTSMIDISDGLASELNHICKASGCGARIFDEHIPIDPQAVLLLEEMKINPTLAALNGGEDYELLFSVAPEDYEKIKDMEGLSFIGHMTDINHGVKLQTRDGLQHDLESKGWNAFGKQ